jgi:hypothetical protein
MGSLQAKMMLSAHGRSRPAFRAMSITSTRFAASVLKRSIAVSCRARHIFQVEQALVVVHQTEVRGEGDDELGVTKTIVLPEPARSSLILTASATALTEW